MQNQGAQHGCHSCGAATPRTRANAHHNPPDEVQTPCARALIEEV
ncbi:MAG: hypothetical protein AAFV96_05915 [Pseudomonadota bacterium]